MSQHLFVESQEVVKKVWNSRVFSLNFFCWTRRMQFWQISRCSVCQSSDFFAQGPRITEKKYNFFKTTVFSAKICFCGQVNCCLVKKSAEKLSTEKQNFYAQASEELFATSKTDENINGKLRKIMFLQKIPLDN